MICVEPNYHHGSWTMAMFADQCLNELIIRTWPYHTRCGCFNYALSHQSIKHKQQTDKRTMMVIDEHDKFGAQHCETSKGNLFQ